MMPVAYRVLGSAEPGLESRSGDGIAPVLSLRVEGDVWSVYITANPDKLARGAGGRGRVTQGESATKIVVIGGSGLIGKNSCRSSANVATRRFLPPHPRASTP